MFRLNLCLPDSLLLDLKAQKSPAQDSFLFAIIKNNSQGGDQLARSNYQFKKRQKELARKKKKDQKRQRKLDENTIKSEENQDQSNPG